MLEKITVENLFCFKNSTSLSFLASKERNRNTDDLYCGFTTLNKQNILKLVYVFGNNGAGKSKFLRSFALFRGILLHSNKEKMDKLPYHPFAFDESYLSRPSAVSAVFNIGESRFRYNLRWDATRIVEETIELLKTQTSIVLLKRSIDSDFTVIIEDNRKLALSSSDRDIIKRDALCNSSILSYVPSKNIENPTLNEIFNYFNEGFRFVRLEEVNLPDSLPDGRDKSKQRLKQVVLNVMQSVDSNIKDYEVFDVKPELPQEILDMFKDRPDMITAFLKSLPKHAVNTLHNVNGEKLIPLPLDDQSEGTKDMLRLLVVLNNAISKGRMVILDDFSSGIHKTSLQEILKFFLGVDKHGQLVIASQDRSLLDSTLVRRDSVRLAIKDQYGVSTIENLALKDIHKNLSLSKYLFTNNKFGQLPEIKPEFVEKAIEIYNQFFDATIETYSDKDESVDEFEE